MPKDFILSKRSSRKTWHRKIICRQSVR